MNRYATLVAVAVTLGGVALAEEHSAGNATRPSALDPLQMPARLSRLAEQRLITAIGHVGDKDLVAVGERGHILRSTDGGRSWQQSASPVSSDLTAVQFVDANTGYAVGHDGVVLRSDDAGKNWRLLFDGMRANQQLLKDMQQRVAEKNSPHLQDLLAEARRNADAGPDKPFLDLHFRTADEGYVVGAYNLIFQTRDGGKSWQSCYDRTDNPKLLNLYAIKPAAGTLVVAGEGGLVMAQDAASGEFRQLPSPYKGSWFGVLALTLEQGQGLLAYGMRGHAYASSDLGRHWQALDTGLGASITAADASADGRIALVDQAGNVALSRNGGASFERVPQAAPQPITAVALTPAGLSVGGPRGLRQIEISKEP